MENFGILQFSSVLDKLVLSITNLNKYNAMEVLKSVHYLRKQSI